MKLILQKPEVSGRLTKWAIELSEFDIEYLPRIAIKAQAVADFVAEFTEPSMEVARMMLEQNKKVFKWQLRVDGSSNTHGSGAGVVVSIWMATGRGRVRTGFAKSKLAPVKFFITHTRP